MCRKETKQAYYILRAFKEAGRPMTRQDLDLEVERLLKPQGVSRLEEIGHSTTRGLLNKLGRERFTTFDDAGRMLLTPSGDELTEVLRVFVEPDVAA